MSKDCIFCKIIQGEIPASRVYEDELFLCIKDIQPQAKSHFLVLPKEHLTSLETIFPDKTSKLELMVGKMFSVGTELARKQGLLPGGFRTVINTGPHSGQTVFHIHLHVLGGEPLGHFGA